MIRLKDIQEALFGVVGFEQAYNPAESIDGRLTESESGLTFQGAHPLLTLRNIRETMPEDFGFIYPEWNSTSAYAKNDKVRHLNEEWIAKVANVGEEPSEDSEMWAKYNLLSDYLERAERNGINAVVQKFLEDKSLKKETRTLMERRTFFDGAGRLQAIIDNRNKIVGMEIVPVRAMGVTAKIERIGLQMVGSVGQITMYLFHSSHYAPMQTITLNFSSTSGGFQWFTPKEPIYLPYMGANDSGGAWYLCYNQADLPRFMNAINVTKDWSKDPCETCTGSGLESWRELTKYLQVSPFCVSAPEGFKENPQLWDVARMAYTNTQNYGINCEISVGCDLTDFIIEQRGMFANVIQKQVASNLLRTMAMNPETRVNRNQSNVNKMELLYEIDGNTNSTRPNGLAHELKKAYEALSLDTRGIDRICLACNNHGVRYRGI